MFIDFNLLKQGQTESLWSYFQHLDDTCKNMMITSKTSSFNSTSCKSVLSILDTIRDLLNRNENVKKYRLTNLTSKEDLR